VVSFYFFLLLSIFLPRLISAVPDWMSTILAHMMWLSANLGSEMCCTGLYENTRPIKSPKIRHLGTIAQHLSGYVFTTKAHIDNRKKNSLNSNIFSTCLHNMVNFGSLTAVIGLPVWGTPANFNGFRVLAVLLHGTLARAFYFFVNQSLTKSDYTNLYSILLFEICALLCKALCRPLSTA